MTPDECAKTALLLIDMQVDFGAREGAMARRGADIVPARAAVTRAETLVAAARAAGVAVVFVRLLDGDEDLCIAGTRGADFIGPQPAAGEAVISKRRFSAFANTGLAGQLRAQGIDTLVLAGLTTECCVAATAWAAFEEGFRVILAADACAAYESDLHSHALKSLQLSGAIGGDVAALVDAWKNIQ